MDSAKPKSRSPRCCSNHWESITSKSWSATPLRQAPDTEPLCALLLEKTGGNLFFLGQFLRSLHDEKLIFFDATEQKWCFDLSEIKGAALPTTSSS